MGKGKLWMTTQHVSIHTEYAMPEIQKNTEFAQSLQKRWMET